MIEAGGIASALQGSTFTLCNCWQIIQVNGLSSLCTDHDKTIHMSFPEAFDFTPAPAIRASSRRRTTGTRANGITLEGSYADNVLAYSDFREGKFNGGSVWEFIVDWTAPWYGHLGKQKYLIDGTEFNPYSWKIHCVSYASRLKRCIGHEFTRNCRHVLGNTKCGVDLESFTVSDTVASVANNMLEFDGNLPHYELDGYYNNGFLEWTSGNNIGLQVEIETHVDDTLHLRIPMPHAIEVGDAFEMIAGCDKTIATCATKFSNNTKFGGFPFIPGDARLIRGPLIADVPRDAGK